MANICQITGKKVITGNNVSHSKRRTRRRFYPNLMDKKFYLPEEDRFVELKVSTKGLKMINKKGLKNCLDEAVSKGYLKTY